MVAFLILSGLARPDVVSAQGNENHQYTMSHYGTDWQAVPLFLDEAGNPVEIWVNTWFHCVCHYIDGQQTYMLMRWRGTATYDGIVYEINDMVTYGMNGAADWNDPAYYALKFVSNVKGSDGSHLVASGVFTMYDADWNWVGTFEYDKFVSN